MTDRLRAALIAASLTAASVVHAAPPRVALVVDPCVPVRANDVRRIVGIELGALLDDAGIASETHTLAAISCAGGVLQLRVDDPVTRKALTRQLDLAAAAPEGHARLIGLAVAELISASWSELIVTPEPKVHPSGPPPSKESRAAALAAVSRPLTPSLLRPRLVALGAGFGLFAGTGLLGGGGVRVGQLHRRHLGWWLDLYGLHTSVGTSLGQVSTDVVAAGAAFVGHQSWSRVALSGGVGLRAGALRLSGEPRDGNLAVGNASWAGWVGPMATVGLVAAPARRLALEIGLEAGYVLTPVGGLVDNQRELAFSGAWVAFQVGVGFFL